MTGPKQIVQNLRQYEVTKLNELMSRPLDGDEQVLELCLNLGRFFVNINKLTSSTFGDSTEIDNDGLYATLKEKRLVRFAYRNPSIVASPQKALNTMKERLKTQTSNIVGTFGEDFVQLLERAIEIIEIELAKIIEA